MNIIIYGKCLIENGENECRKEEEQEQQFKDWKKSKHFCFVSDYKAYL